MLNYFNMIGFLSGEILKANDKFIILGVSGVGYKVYCDTKNFNINSDLSKLHTRSENNSEKINIINLHIHTVVREDALELFGFEREEELALFEKLIGISGIGPRSALLIVGKGTIDSLSEAINTGDLGYLTAVSGIGKKTAEKIILELRGALSDLTFQNVDSEVIDALKALGYSERDAQSTVKSLDMKGATTEEKIKKALKYLGK
jgi:holliday junction DNA helicase RuvA